MREVHRDCIASGQMEADDSGSDSHVSDSPVSREIHRVMGDATNVTALRDLKAHVVQVHSVYHVGLGTEDQDGADASTLLQHTVMPDLALVPPTCRGIHTRALYHHQMTAVGAPTWLLPTPHTLCHLRVFLWISDAGAEQKECYQLIHREAVADMFTLTHHDDCTLHQLALIDKSQHERAVDYIRKLATITNTWRTSGTAWKIRGEWTRLFGEASTKRCVARLPQRALKGRWGYIDNCEEFYIELDPAELSQVFAAVWPPSEHKPKKRSITALERATAGLDEDDIDYGEKVGRWIRESITAVNDQAFWAQLHVQHYSRGPIAQATRAVQKNNSMLHLVAYVVPSVMDSMDELLGETMVSCWLAALEHTPEDAHSDILLDIVTNCVSVVCNFIRWVERPCTDFPRLLVWLTSVEQGIRNDFIADICRRLSEIMRAAPHTMDELTVKFWAWLQSAS